ncbi:MAG: PAS domain-containing sensor histidine kinase [Methanococcoides sp.]|nr:PAS domain-containing sensor histidine kinase [Methanococcoides sp.]
MDISEKLTELENEGEELRTKLKLANEKIGEIEEFCKLHIENLNDVIFSIDEQGNFTYISPAIENFTGYSPEEVKGTSFMQYIHPEDLPGLLQDIDLTLEGEHKPYMFRIVSKTGSITYVHTSSKGIVKDGRVVGINGIMVNIAQLKRIELELMKEKEKAQHYLDVAGVAIIVINNDFRISLVNKKACELLGYKEHELFNMNWFEMIIPEMIRESVTQSFMLSCYGDIASTPFECAINTKEDLIRLCSWKCTQLKDENGHNTGCILAGEDITERKEVEEALLKAKYMAEDASRTKSEFIANMSHELRTPLNAVIGFSEVLIERKFGDVNEKQDQYLRNISTSGKKLLEIINSILEISKIESGSLDMEYQTSSIEDLIEEIKEDIEEYLPDQAEMVSFEILTDISHIIADTRKVEKSVFHLIENAIKFSDKTNQVKVRIEAVDEMIAFKVTDRGIGISEEDIDKLFEPFSQLDPSSTRIYSGLGVGLYLIKKFAELHGGCLGIKSELEKGSTFTFAIPTKPAKIRNEQS